MASPKIQLLVFDGCPLAEAARSSLQTALDSLGLRDFEEIDLLGPSASDELQGWGSPTILVDGKELTGSMKGNAVGCRVYDDESGVPSPEVIAEQIRRVTSSE
jgi:mercuric ion transport protein